MSNEKTILSRIIHKHDIEANWNKATGFIPKQGEIIVYDIDENYNYERFKIGDGKTTVINLPFQKTNINDLKAVSYDIAQELTDEQKIQARANIGAGTPDSIKIIEATYSANGESTISSTEEEINALIAEGKNVCIDCFIEPEDRTFRFYFSTKTSSGTTLFVNTEVSDGAPELKLLTLIGSTFMIITMPVPLRSLATESKDGLMSTEDKVKLDSVEEGAQVNVQSDLSQTDEAASDYVKGVIRQESLPEGYPYEEVREVVILPETEFSTVYAGRDSRDSITVDSNFKFEDGIEYIITFNGAKYICKRNVYNEITFLGNAYISYNILPGNPFDSMDTNEPFMIFIEDSEPTTLYINTINPIDCSVSIVYDDSITHAIDYKYMPEGYPYEEIKVFDITNWEYSLSSFYDSLNISHNKNIPFALGQVWSVYGDSVLSNKTDVYECVVQQTDDGILYIGDSELTSIPFCVTVNEAAISEAFQTQFTDANTSDKVATLCLKCVSGVVTNTTIHPMDEKFLPSSAMAQSDWSVNDENDPAYVKNRTHWEEPIELFNIENAEFTNGQYINETPFVITVGNTYIVNWDGTEYTCTAHTFSGLPVIGNTSEFGGKGNNEPFFIIYVSAENINPIMALDGSTTTHTVSVVENIVHTIDHKYIKDMYYSETVLQDVEYYAGGGCYDNGANAGTFDPIPLAVGDKYQVYFSFNDGELQPYSDEWYEVLEDDDGLYIGDPGLSNPMFCIRETITYTDNRFNSTENNLTKLVIRKQMEVEDIHQIDEKYLSILKENNKEIFSIYNISSGKYETDTVLSVGTYNVIIDDTVIKTDFINDGGAIICKNDLCFIASFAEGMLFEFFDGGTHSVKIEIPQNVIKEEYLPDGYPYEEIVMTDISGQEYTITGFKIGTNNVTHNFNIPFALGQVWRCSGVYAWSDPEKIVEMGEFNVRQTIDGTLYIGETNFADAVAGTILFYVTQNEAEVTDTWGYAYYTDLIIECISGEAPTTIVHTIDEKFLPESATTQSDWSVNDESSTDYIKNRTHYEYIDMVDISYYDDSGYLCATLEEGKTYNVKIGEQVYKDLVCYYCSWYYQGNRNFYLLGGSDAIDTNTWTYGFLLHQKDGESQIRALCIDDTFDFTIRSNEYSYGGFLTENNGVGILGGTKAVHKLDEKFLPVATDDEILEMLMEHDMLLAVTDSDGFILSDENNNILLW